MKLEIKNIDLVRVINFLDTLEIGGLKGIHRTNLSFKLQEQLQTVVDAEKKIVEEYKDNKDKRNEDLQALHEEKAVIDTGDARAMLESVKTTIKDVANDEDRTFKNDDAYGLAIMFNAFGLEGGDE